MWEHYCEKDKSLYSVEGECNWCGATEFDVSFWNPQKQQFQRWKSYCEEQLLRMGDL